MGTLSLLQRCSQIIPSHRFVVNDLQYRFCKTGINKIDAIDKLRPYLLESADLNMEKNNMNAIAPAGRTIIAALTLCSINLFVGSHPALAADKAKADAVVVWDGTGAGWTNPTTSTIQAETTDVHGSNAALQFKFSGTGQWLGAGWNWLGFKKGAIGTDITQMQFLTFWVKSTGTVADLQINLLSNGAVADTPEHHTDKIKLSDFADLHDGAWHEVKIPLTALKQPEGFDAKHVCEMQIGLYADHAVDGSYIFDSVEFQP